MCIMEVMDLGMQCIYSPYTSDTWPIRGIFDAGKRRRNVVIKYLKQGNGSCPIFAGECYICLFNTDKS